MVGADGLWGDGEGLGNAALEAFPTVGRDGEAVSIEEFTEIVVKFGDGGVVGGELALGVLLAGLVEVGAGVVDAEGFLDADLEVEEVDAHGRDCNGGRRCWRSRPEGWKLAAS